MLLDGGSHVRGQSSVVLKPIADTTLFELDPNNNLGGYTDFASGTIANSANKSRGLMKFDVAGMVPAGAIISSASLGVKVTKIPGGSVSSTYDLRRVLVDWGEGTKSSIRGLPAAANEASWNNRRTSVAPWTIPGGGIGTDFASSLSASRLIGGLSSYTFASTAGLVADVQQWLDNPASNFGWVFISQSEATLRTAHRFGTRENTLNSPMLTIQFTVVPEPSSLALLSTGAVCVWWMRRCYRRK